MRRRIKEKTLRKVWIFPQNRSILFGLTGGVSGGTEKTSEQGIAFLAHFDGECDAVQQSDRPLIMSYVYRVLLLRGFSGIIKSK